MVLSMESKLNLAMVNKLGEHFQQNQRYNGWQFIEALKTKSTNYEIIDTMKALLNFKQLGGFCFQPVFLSSCDTMVYLLGRFPD